MAYKNYYKCELLGMENAYVYAELNHGNFNINGRDLVTGIRLVDLYNSLENAAIADPIGSGNMHLYVNISGSLTKAEVIDILTNMSKEDVENYVKNIEENKKMYKETKKRIRQDNKAAIKKYRQEKKEIRFAKRKVKMITKKANFS